MKLDGPKKDLGERAFLLPFYWNWFDLLTRAAQYNHYLGKTKEPKAIKTACYI
jgi:hypothetical protein